MSLCGNVMLVWSNSLGIDVTGRALVACSVDVEDRRKRL